MQNPELTIPELSSITDAAIREAFAWLVNTGHFENGADFDTFYAQYASMLRLQPHEVEGVDDIVVALNTV